jgi:simple sugar transport system substrate-binding protein
MKRALAVRRALARCALTVAAAALLACGGAPDGDGAGAGGAPDRGAVRIVVITHGQSSDAFWSVVANGVRDAARDLGVRAEYQAPLRFDMVEMSERISAATAARPAGIVVSIPDPDALAPAIRAAIEAGIPVVSINSGADAWERLGALAHVGQTEYEAGFGAGERLAAAGARRALCVNHEVGNAALDQRCDGMRDALARSGGAAEVLAVDLADPADAEQRIRSALASGPEIDAILTLGPAGAGPALAARGAGSRVALATFDLTPDVLAAVRDGDILFAVDQQPYLQGYLAIVILVAYLETGAAPGGGDVVRTGPGFVTRENAAAVIERSARGLR